MNVANANARKPKLLEPVMSMIRISCVRLSCRYMHKGHTVQSAAVTTWTRTTSVASVMETMRAGYQMAWVVSASRAHSRSVPAALPTHDVVVLGTVDIEDLICLYGNDDIQDHASQNLIIGISGAEDA